MFLNFNFLDNSTYSIEKTSLVNNIKQIISLATNHSESPTVPAQNDVNNNPSFESEESSDDEPLTRQYGTNSPIEQENVNLTSRDQHIITTIKMEVR